MSWFLAFAGFAALIILHEAGHFAAAKAVGMRVERFMLFFPPILAKVRRGETEYGFGAIPLGGYVKITGMSPHEDIPPEHQHRAYLRQPVWKRIVVISAGPAMNLVLAFLILLAIFWSNGVFETALAVESVQRDGAAATRLQPGDRILSVDGRPGDAPGLSQDEVIARQKALRAAVNRHRCAGRRTDGCVATTPAPRRRAARRRAADPAHPAALRRRARERCCIGFSYAVQQPPPGPGRTRPRSRWTRCGRSPRRRSTRSRACSTTPRPARTSPASSAPTRPRASPSSSAPRQALYVLALISLSLAVVNLFPFLPLDGGHIFWALAEKIRGRPIPFALIERASVVGFLLVAFLFITGLSNDIGRLRGDGFGVR